MKYTSLIALLILSCATVSAQKDKTQENYSDPFQLDSSEYFLIPRLIDSDNESQFGKGKGYLPLGNYRDITFYNSKTNQSKKVFGNQLAIIYPFFARRYNYYYGYEEKTKETPQNILPKHIVYLATTENYNGDGGLDTEDPVYLYVSDRKGDQLKQITPKAVDVLSWTVSKDQKMILVKARNDKNGNKKFGLGDDQVYYRIDLDDDISKIQCYQITL